MPWRSYKEKILLAAKFYRFWRVLVHIFCLMGLLLMEA